MSSTGILFSFNGDWITQEWIDEGKKLAVVQQQFLRALIANTFWQIWKERNARQYSNNSSSIQIEANSALEAQAKAMEEAIAEAHQHGIQRHNEEVCCYQVLFVKREANMVADWLATRANLPQSSLFTNANRHPELCRMLDKDIGHFLLLC
uniref:Uncharacterized protein n=1 Tax=Ananas comosus var. bracteatus TaxID=296719 RepID=A0A6V7PDK3_ANACO|nr:unnamed protein product [Ananas comosus var. bracteatus]